MIPYIKDGFIIFGCGKSYVVYNMSKKFKGGHSHLRSFKACKDAITFATKKKIPKRCSFYYLTTLQRISDDEKYRQDIDDLIEVRKRKGKKPKYVNKSP